MGPRGRPYPTRPHPIGSYTGVDVFSDQSAVSLIDLPIAILNVAGLRLTYNM